MTKIYLGFLILIFINLSCSPKLINKETLLDIKEFQGQQRLWIHDINALSNDKYLVKGGFIGELKIGDTIINNKEYTFFFTLFEKEIPTKTFTISQITGCKLFLNNDKGYIISGYTNSTYTDIFISYFDSEFNQLWRNDFSLKSIKRNVSSLTVLDVKFDNTKNAYALMRINEGNLEFADTTFSSEANVLIKFDSKGNISFKRNISPRYMYNKLVLTSDLIYATSNRYFLACDLNGNPVSNNKYINQSITSDVFNNGYYKLTTNNSRPEKYTIVKYNKFGDELIKKQIFECNGQERSGELKDFDKRHLIFINTNHVGQPAGNGLSNYEINFLLIDKKGLRIKNSWTIKCKNIYEKIELEKINNFVYIGLTYFKEAKFDGISFNNDNELTNESMAILRYKIK